MDLMSDDAIGAFGLLLGEACEKLVDSHDESLDKRAAMLSVDSPALAADGNHLNFSFKVAGNRQKPIEVSIAVTPSSDADPEDFDESTLELSVDATPSCSCAEFNRGARCWHTLAAAWWLQEQLGRRGISDVLEFFGELKVDTVAEGRALVDDLLEIAAGSQQTPKDAEQTQLQWRISLSESRYYSPIAITAYEQRPRKNGKGWTKGREIRSYDLLRRDFTANPIDGRVAAIAAGPSYSFDDDFFLEFQALQALVGHPNVTWDDAAATPVDVISGELVLRLQPVRVDVDASRAGDGQVEKSPDEEPGDASRMTTRFRPCIEVSGIHAELDQCEVLLGYAHPAEPLVVVADQVNHRLVVCTLRDPTAVRMVEYLLQCNFSDVLLDGDAASRFAVGSRGVDSLIRVDLPPQLSGPVEPADIELVFEMRPRSGAGLHIALAVHEPRFRELATPASPPDVVPCFTEQGPVRVERDLPSEQTQADEVIQRFGLNQLSTDGSYRWVAETDDRALELLGALYSAGDAAPRMIWPDGESIRVRGEITPAALRVQIDDRHDWFGLSGSISLDGREVELSQLLAAVRENRALVQVGDREFAKISDAFRRRLQQLDNTVVTDRGSLRVADAVVPAVQDLISDDVPLEATARWHDSINRLESLRNWTPHKPQDLVAELRDYQLDGYQWLARLSSWGVGGVLADDMGLGKTVQALGVLLDRGEGGPALVVAPTSVGDNWVRETERFAPRLKPHLYRDSDRNQLIQSAGPEDLVIVSYQLVQRDAKRFASRRWHTVVLDEAQFIKNSQTKTAQAIRRIDADWRVGLSGTPLENHLGELWSLFRALSPGMLGSWERFRERFADPIERQKDTEQRESLARLVQPFILRRTKGKVLSELPPRTEITLKAELSTAERRRYEDTRLAALAELSGVAEDDAAAGQRRIRTLAWLTRLRQLACHPKLVDSTWKKGSAKLSLLLEVIEELREEDHRALVFSQFVKHLAVVRAALDDREISYQYLDGATPAKERQHRVDAFQRGEGELFLISLKAGGTGLNLTGADYVIHLDPWWNPAVEDQATDRAHRIGQDRPVTVYRLVAESTIEEKILQMHADKRELIAGVLDGTDKAAKMDTEDLIRLIKEGAVA